MVGMAYCVTLLGVGRVRKAIEWRYPRGQHQGQACVDATSRGVQRQLIAEPLALWLEACRTLAKAAGHRQLSCPAQGGVLPRAS